MTTHSADPVQSAAPARTRSPVLMLDRPWFVLALLVVLAVAARFVTLGNPALGYDEQFYLLVGDRMLHGELPYVDIFDRKPVGIFLIYAGARLLGGEGFLEYKLVALVFVIATAWLLYAMARQRAGQVGALLAASLYILWLNFMEGEGGQTPVFYNLFVLGAAAMLFAAARNPRRLWLRGSAAMLLTGIAIQIKYSVVFEGVFFGCAFLWLAWRHGTAWRHMALYALLWAGLALSPTILALFYYWSAGHLPDFMFANFLSVFGQSKGPLLDQIPKLLGVSAILLPLALIALVGRRGLRGNVGPEAKLLRGWLLVAIFGVVIYWRFNSPHYALPVLTPFCLLIAPALDDKRRLSAGIAVIAFLVGQAVQYNLLRLKGGGAEMRAIAQAAKPNKGCIFIYNGYPGLYMMTGSCLPSRWPFPGHVNAQDENNAAALGVDPVAEVKAIMARNPDAVIDTFPPFARGNHAARAAVYGALRTRYAVAACVLTPGGRTRVVYRLKQDTWPRHVERCPSKLLAEFR